MRYKKRPVKFAALKLLFIFASIALNIAYFVGMKGAEKAVYTLSFDMKALTDGAQVRFFIRDAKSRPPDDGRTAEFNLQHIEKAKRGKIPAWPWNLNAFLLKV